MTVIEIKGLKKKFVDNINSQALKGIDLKFGEQEFVAILGSSGCGKSTLLNCMATLEKPSEGSINFYNEVVTDFNEEEAADFRRSSIGIVCKNDMLISEMTVEENILLPMILDQGNQKVMKKRLEKVTKFLGIYSIVKRKINQISALESKKVSLARALVHSPSVIVCDEPTSNLNSIESLEMLEILHEIKKAFSTAIIIATSSPYSASFSDRTIFMKDGLVLDYVENQGSDEDYYKRIALKFTEVEYNHHAELHNKMRERISSNTRALYSVMELDEENQNKARRGNSENNVSEDENSGVSGKDTESDENNNSDGNISSDKNDDAEDKGVEYGDEVSESDNKEKEISEEVKAEDYDKTNTDSENEDSDEIKNEKNLLDRFDIETDTVFDEDESDDFIEIMENTYESEERENTEDGGNDNDKSAEFTGKTSVRKKVSSLDALDTDEDSVISDTEDDILNDMKSSDTIFNIVTKEELEQNEKVKEEK